MFDPMEASLRALCLNLQLHHGLWWTRFLMMLAEMPVASAAFSELGVATGSQVLGRV